MKWLRHATKDMVFTFILLTVFGILSLATVVSARNAQTAAEKSQVIIERSNVNSPLIKLIEDCTNPNGECAKRSAANLSNAIILITAQQACVVKESLGYNLPDRSPAEVAEIKSICHTLLGGDALELLRRVDKNLSTTSTTGG